MEFIIDILFYWIALLFSSVIWFVSTSEAKEAAELNKNVAFVLWVIVFLGPIALWIAIIKDILT